MSFDPTQAHFDIADRLAGDAYFSLVRVVTELPRTLTADDVVENPVEQALAIVQGGGAAVLVMLPDCGGTTTDNPLYFDSVVFELAIMVNDLLNVATDGANKRAWGITAQCARLLHGFAAPGAFNEIVVGNISPLRLSDLSENAQRMMKGIPFAGQLMQLTTQCELTALAKVATPTPAEAAGVVTLTCATAGVSIYYTTDGSYPGSGNSGASLYSGTFTLTTDCWLRVAAEKNGSAPSNVATAHFTP